VSPPLRLAEAMGVSRVARVTGLDRAGVEVACAVRPGGHVLQVCNGKGSTFEEAARGALHETAELWAAEHCAPASLRWGSQEAWQREGAEAWSAEDVSAGSLAARRLWSPRFEYAWREAVELHSGRAVWVLAQAVHCLPAGGALLGPLHQTWTSNGSGAHGDARAALLHALLEATERDQLARSLPRAWTPAALRERMLSPGQLAMSVRRTARLATELEARGFRVHLFDASAAPGTDGAVDLPVAGAFLVDPDEGPVPLAAGYACRLGWDDALHAALLEAAQSRLTDIHGAREDVSSESRAAGLALGRACARVKAQRTVARPSRTRVSGDVVASVLSRLKRAGFRRVAAVQLEAPVPELHVVRVLVPGFRLSELL